MANKIKYNSGIDANALDIGNWSVSTPGTNMGPTTTTGFKNGVNIPNGGYAIYTEGINVRIANNDLELIQIINALGASIPEDDVNSALNWAKDNNILVLNDVFSNTSTNGLVLNLDAKHTSSYFSNVPSINALSSGDPDLNHMIIWTNSGSWHWTDNATDIPVPFTYGASGLKMMRGKSDTTGSQHFGCASFNGSASTTYTISVFYRQNRAGASSPYFRTKTNNNFLAYFNYNGDTNSVNWPVDKWIRISATATLQSNETGAYLSNYIGRAAEDIVRYYAPMVELGDTMSPFVNGTRSQNNVWYDLSGNNKNHNIVNNPAYSGYDFTLNETQGFNLGSSVTKSTNSTVVIWYKTTDTQELWVRGDSGSEYIAAAYPNVNYYHQSSGSPTYYADRNVITNPNTQGVRNGKYHMWEAKNVNFSAWDSMNWFLYGSSWNMNGSVAKIMVYDRTISDAESDRNYYGGSIVTNGIAHMWDAGNIVSYEPNSILVNNLKSSINGTMEIDTYQNADSGYWSFNDNNSILLDGSTDSFRLNQGDNWTVNAWVRTTTAGGGSIGDQPIMSNSQSGPVYSAFKIHNGKVGYSHYNNGWRTNTGLINVNDNKWHMLTWVNLGNGKMNIYVDGKLDVVNMDATLSAANRIDVIGSSWSNKFTGDISVVQVNYHSFDQDDVLQNYNAHVARFK